MISPSQESIEAEQERLLDGLDEQFAEVDGRTICFDTFGDPSDPAVLMVMGLGAQLIHWHPGLCRRIADRGAYVIRFDNRDIGRSTHHHDAPLPKILPIALGFRSTMPYRLTDMAGDAIALLDHLAIDAAHIVGASLGGAISQTIALEYPTRVLSLTSIMAPTGLVFGELPRPRLMPKFLRPTPSSDPVETIVGFNRLIASPAHPFDEITDRARVSAAKDRAFDPVGVQRQLAAMLGSGSRRKRFGEITAPTLIIHGADDPLVPVRAARAMAKAMPTARLEVIAGMGHDAPRPLWPTLVDLVTGHITATGSDRLAETS